MVNEWSAGKLGELVAFTTGKLDSNASVPDGDYPFFTCSQETLRTNTFSFDTECVLLGGNNANGIFPLKYFQGKFDAYQRTYVIKPRDTNVLITKFLYYALRPKLSELRSFSTGAATKFLTMSILNDTEINVPPLPVQRKIAGILSAYDELIENSQRRIKILESMARALYREWFVNFRFPGHEKVELVPSPLGKIPEGWEVRKLGEIAENFDRLRKPLSKMQRSKVQGKHPYYGAAKVFDYINDFIFDGEYLLMAEDGSVITTARAPVLQLVNEKFWPNNHTHVLRGKMPFSTHFLYLGLSEVDISPYITGAAQPKITQENMNRIPFFCGPNSLHEYFNRLVQQMIQQSQFLQRQVQNLRQTRDLLLPRLLSGQHNLSEIYG